MAVVDKKLMVLSEEEFKNRYKFIVQHVKSQSAVLCITFFTRFWFSVKMDACYCKEVDKAFQSQNQTSVTVLICRYTIILCRLSRVHLSARQFTSIQGWASFRAIFRTLTFHKVA